VKGTEGGRENTEGRELPQRHRGHGVSKFIFGVIMWPVKFAGSSLPVDARVDSDLPADYQIFSETPCPLCLCGKSSPPCSP
jgi:hypothetical protein